MNNRSDSSKENDRINKATEEYLNRIRHSEEWREKFRLEEEKVLKDIRETELRRLRIETAQRKFAFAASSFVALVGLLASLLIAGPLAINNIFDKDIDGDSLLNTSVHEKSYNKKLTAIQKEIALLKSDGKSLAEAIKNLPSTSQNVETNLAISRMNEIDKRLSALEAAIVNDPEKALAIPILRKDLDNAFSTLQAQQIDLRARIEQTYEIYKWLIGLLITVVIGVLGMVVNTWVNRKA